VLNPSELKVGLAVSAVAVLVWLLRAFLPALPVSAVAAEEFAGPEVPLLPLVFPGSGT